MNMDPNMMNQNNQSGGMQQPQNQNQVLNYDDVNNVAQKEKKSTSTKKLTPLGSIFIFSINGKVFISLLIL